MVIELAFNGAGADPANDPLTQAVMALPDDLRQAVLLHYAEGMTPSDIARLNGEAPSTVTRRLDPRTVPVTSPELKLKSSAPSAPVTRSRS